MTKAVGPGLCGEASGFSAGHGEIMQASSVLRSVILGDLGSVKSSLLRAIALSWAEKSMAGLKDRPVPILIELRLYAQDKAAGICNSFLEYLHKGNTACRLNQIKVDALLKSGKAVALLMGLTKCLIRSCVRRW